ncbi:hypothetical protein [Neomoorella thermoacetica]|uniref:hypothetical protein n=1 Tax=Neomoorella thermoacetica TaxID=1525 RepID=UPI0015A5B6D6|nr:hypothetical protein [Moorella thermoacetica]
MKREPGDLPVQRTSHLRQERGEAPGDDGKVPSRKTAGDFLLGVARPPDCR